MQQHMFENETIKKTAKFIQEKILVYEMWILLIILATFIMHIATNNKLGFLVNIVFMLSGTVYFFSAFISYLYPEATKFDQFYIRLVGLDSSVICIGILFKLSHYPMAELLMNIGLITLGGVFVVMLFLKSQESRLLFFNKALPYRFVIFIVIAAMVYILKIYAT